jgi:hypothetical protein
MLEGGEYFELLLMFPEFRWEPEFIREWRNLVTPSLLQFQSYRCAVCGVSGREHHLFIDHDHRCERHSCGTHTLLRLLAVNERCWCVRGFVCRSCNARLYRIEAGLHVLALEDELRAYLADPPAQRFFRMAEKWVAR